MTGPLDRRTALVTGAGRGLGRAYALALAERGARVAVNNRSPEPAAEVVAEIVARGGEALACAGDLEDAATARRVVADATDALGRLDILVNNAGGAEIPPAPFTETTADARDGMLRQNFTTAWDVTAAAWPHLADSDAGRIVLCGSPLSLYGSAGFAHYAAAKGALIGLARTLAIEGADDEIATNLILPVADTRREPEDSDFYRWFAATLPVERVAALVAWLADPRCQISGEVLSIAGPRVARVSLAQTRGYVDSGEAFTPDSIAANWSAVEDGDDQLAFTSLGEVMAHWHEVFGAPG
ncbi:MAG: SDR family NAD(P)-dependent oxidoreductase [Solirubrobacterales bacterium]